MTYWKRVDDAGITLSVESYSFSNDISCAIRISEAEYRAFIANLPTEPATFSMLDKITSIENRLAIIESKLAV